VCHCEERGDEQSALLPKQIARRAKQMLHFIQHGTKATEKRHRHQSA